jgi:hypothetical protein
MRKNVQVFFAGLILGVALMAILAPRVMPSSPTKSTLKILVPGGKGGIELNVEGDSVDYEKVLSQLFADDFMKDAAIKWLEKKERIYPIESPDLAAAISSELCSPIPDAPMEARLEKGRECAQKPVVKALRELASEHRPPFHYVGITGKLGVPDDENDQPAKGKASVCRDSDFFGKNLQVVNPLDSTAIEVEATGYYLCTHAVTFPDIQLGSEDATRLFPKTVRRRLEDVIIVPLE